MEQNRNARKGQRMLTGMFADRESAESAYNTLQDRGYTNEEIDLIMSHMDQSVVEFIPLLWNIRLTMCINILGRALVSYVKNLAT